MRPEHISFGRICVGRRFESGRQTDGCRGAFLGADVDVECSATHRNALCQVADLTLPDRGVGVWHVVAQADVDPVTARRSGQQKACWQVRCV